MPFYQSNEVKTQAGFSLIELMVGLAIGLLVTLIVSQTMGVFDKQKRSTTGTADAQTNGNIGLFTIERDMKQAGYALMPQGVANTADSALDCTTVNVNSSGVTSIYPVDITNGVSDSITIRYGNGSFGGAITGLNDSITTAGADRSVDSNLGCSMNDVAIIMNGATCDLTQIRGVSTVNTITDPQTVKLSDVVGTNGNDFACLGPWTEVTYRVNNNNLERVVGGVATIVMNDVVNIQAQYGVSSIAGSNQINQWVDDATWPAPTPANRKLIKAIRIALVARNAQIDTSVVTTGCGANANGPCAWADVPVGGSIITASPAPTIDLSATANWNFYHYRVFETVIPLRNEIWAKDTL
jgi:type IV pilus assembly protein PilW